jgi:tRNA G10  N-methylase Trm11
VTEFVLTAKVCQTNAEQFPDILRLYVPPPAKVLDMTYGNGAFWKKVEGRYDVTKNDIDSDRGSTHHDFTALPAGWRERFGAVVLDPPYLGVGGIETLKASIDRSYKNKARARADLAGISAVRRLYAGGIIEAYRVLVRSGILIIKTMDQVESGQQNWLNVDLMEMCRILGFKNEDLFVYVLKHNPTMRHDHQLHARRNHSYWIVARKRP